MSAASWRRMAGETHAAAMLSRAKRLATHPVVASAASMFVSLFFIAHLVACVWHGLVVVSRANGDSDDLPRHWVSANSLGLASTKRIYLISLYWATTTMTTVGYGDIAIVTNTEKAVAIVVMIIGGICFGYIVGSVTSMLENLDMVGALREHKLDAVKEYLFDREYPGVMACEIKRHFRYVHATLGVFASEATQDEIHDELPSSLSIDLAYELHAGLIQRTPMLSHPRATGPFVAAVCRKLVPCDAADGQFLFFQGDIATHLYILCSGTVKLVRARLAAHQRASDDDDDAGTRRRDDDDDDDNGALAIDNGAVSKRLFAVAKPPPPTTTTTVEENKVVGVPSGTASAGDLVGADALLSETLTHRASAFAYTKAQLYSLGKDDFICELEAHAPCLREWLDLTYGGSAAKAESEPSDDDDDDDAAPCGERQGGAAEPDGRSGPTEKEQGGGETHEQGARGDAGAERGRRAPFLMFKSWWDRLRRWSSTRGSRVEPLGVAATRERRRARGASYYSPAVSARVLYSRHWLFHPESQSKLVWDVAVSVLIIFSVLGGTYAFAFGIGAHELCGPQALVRDRWLAVLVAIDLCFLADMIVTCNTAVLVAADDDDLDDDDDDDDGCGDCDDEAIHTSLSAAAAAATTTTTTTVGGMPQVLVASRSRILSTYAQSGWLVVDLLSSVPLNKVVGCARGSGGGTGPMVFTVLKLLRALRLVRLVKMRQKFKFADLCERLEDYAGIKPALLKLIKPLAVMTMVAHALTCLFFYVGRTHKGNASWLDETQLRDSRTVREEDRPTQYVEAIYWAFATMTTVGYGDVAPALTNASGLAVAIVSQVLGTMIFAYVIGILVALVTNLDPSARLLRAEKAYLGHFVSELPSLSDSLLRRLAAAHAHALSVSGVFDEAAILDQLPPYLRIRCLLYVHRDVLPKMPFLGRVETMAPGSLALILPLLRPVKYLYSHIINSPSISAREIHFLVKGAVLVTRASARRFRGASSKRLLDAAGTPTTTPTLGASDEYYDSHSHFGEATVLVPAETPVKLRCRVICDAPTSHAFVLTKADLETLRDNYEPLLDSIFSDLYDQDLLARWIDLPEAPAPAARVAPAL